VAGGSVASQAGGLSVAPALEYARAYRWSLSHVVRHATDERGGERTRHGDSWLQGPAGGPPEHTTGKLANNVDEMITEVRRQCTHGVDFFTLADSTWGDTQTISPQELAAVAEEAHRRQVRVTIHSLGAGWRPSQPPVPRPWPQSTPDSPIPLPS